MTEHNEIHARFDGTLWEWEGRLDPRRPTRPELEKLINEVATRLVKTEHAELLISDLGNLILDYASVQAVHNGAGWVKYPARIALFGIAECYRAMDGASPDEVKNGLHAFVDNVFDNWDRCRQKGLLTATDPLKD